jgi:hypothetical protein
MVAQLLNSLHNSFHADIVDDQQGVVSRMLALALQDVTQVALVMCFVIIGWLLVSLALRALGIGAVTTAKKHRLKMAQMLHEVPEEQNTVSRSKDQDNFKQDVDRAREGLALLEHYGVFGTKPGTWMGHAFEETRKPQEALSIDLIDGDDATDVIHEEPGSLTPDKSPLMAPKVFGTRTPRGLTLLEQYGVFGVSPKCWRDNQINGFGEILTAIS